MADSLRGLRHYVQRSRRNAPLVLVVLCLSIAVAGCREGTNAPAAPVTTNAPQAPSPSAADTPGKSAAAASTRPTGPAYTIDGSLCNRISFTPLRDWVTRKPSFTYGGPRVQDEGAGTTWVDCDFTASTGLYETNIDVKARTYASAGEAGQAYDAVAESSDNLAGFTATDFFDKRLSGYGELARGYYHANVSQVPPGPEVTSSWYLVVARAGNFVLLVFVERETPVRASVIPKTAMLNRAGPETKAILALIMRS
jgi:hypothetical protein